MDSTPDGPRADQARPTRGTPPALDARLATASFLGNKNLEGSAYLLYATNPQQGTGQNMSFGSFVDYPNDVWEGGVGFNVVEKQFDPAVGFTPRRGFRSANPFLFYMRDRWCGIRRSAATAGAWAPTSSPT